MKIALLSDIHGNLPALEAVIDHASEMKVKAIWNLGDFTGFGANPDEVVKLLKKKKALSIIGNYDQKVLKIPHKSDEWKGEKVPEKWFSFQWSFDHLSKKSINYLTELSETRKENIKGWKIFFSHGSPDAIDEALTDETPQERLRDLAKKAHTNIILCGHSHKPFMRFAGGAIFINPGSVGRPFDGDPRASYAVLSIKKRKVEVDFFRIEYDVNKAAKNQDDAGLPSVYSKMTRAGLSLEDLQVQNNEAGVPEKKVTGKAAAEGKKKNTPKSSTPISQEVKRESQEKVEITREIVQPGEPSPQKTSRKSNRPEGNT